MDITARINRQMYVAHLKEIYDRDFLISNGFCTSDEYNSIEASNLRTNELKRQNTASLMNQVVGAEIF